MAPEPLNAALRSISGFTASRSGSRVLLNERTGWNEEFNGRQKTLSDLARPRLECCTRSQIREEPFERGLAHEESSR